MKTTITIISLSVILACLTLLAQEPARPAAGRGLAGRFKQLDRNGDGKVVAEEFPGPLFTQMDKDGDGFVTLEEAQAFYAGRRAARPAAPEQPTAPPVASEITAVDAVFELCVRDLEACAKFYRDGIGMREVEPADANEAALSKWAGSRQCGEGLLRFP